MLHHMDMYRYNLVMDVVSLWSVHVATSSGARVTVKA